MNRLCVLLAVIVEMIGALFSVQEALAKVITGTAGEDTLVRTDGDDRIKGLRGADRFTGRDGNDRLKGSRGNDRLKGSRGNDRIWGSRGNDKIVPGEDDDTVYAGHGDDLIYARDVGGKDYIDCGPGFDKVETIHSDGITLGNCERAPGPDLGQI